MSEPRQLRAERAALHAAGESAERDWSARLTDLLRDLPDRCSRPLAADLP